MGIWVPGGRGEKGGQPGLGGRGDLGGSPAVGGCGQECPGQGVAFVSAPRVRKQHPGTPKLFPRKETPC